MSSNGLKSMRTLTLATVGIAAWGVDALAEFAHTSLARGQEMEAGAQRLVERYQENARVQAKAAAASRNDLAQQAAVTLGENLKALWRVVVMPEAYKQAAGQPAGPMQPTIEGEHDNGVSSTATEEN